MLGSLYLDFLQREVLHVVGMADSLNCKLNGFPGCYDHELAANCPVRSHRSLLLSIIDCACRFFDCTVGDVTRGQQAEPLLQIPTAHSGCGYQRLAVLGY